MKNPNRALTCAASILIICFTLLNTACKKPVSQVTPPADTIPKIHASFLITKSCNYLALNDTIQLIDSTVIFLNRSDIGLGVSYRWDFGDNTTSLQTEPSHTYSSPGDYKVTLITYLNNLPSDTTGKNVRIIIGQREFRTPYLYTRGVDFDRTAENGALVLLTGNNSYTDPSAFYILSVDSLLHKQWLKSIGSTGIRLSNIKRINPNEFIISGNITAGNTNQFCLSKIDNNGNPVWVRYINLPGTNNYVTPTLDGGFITIGNSNSAFPYHTAVVKCDANGIEVWRKVFGGAQYFHDANNIIETGTGYVFAALLPGSMDVNIALTALDFNGNIARQNIIPSSNAGSISQAGVVHSSNRYFVFAGNTRHGFLFNNNYDHLLTTFISTSGVNGIATDNSSFYIIEGTSQYAYVRKLHPTNLTATWSAGIDNRIGISCSGYLGGATRYGKRVVASGPNEIMALAEGENSTTSQGISAFLVRISNDGLFK